MAGDLLEQYRDSILPARGRGRADRWYFGQVLDFIWRATGLWAVLFAAAFLARTALDWRVPPADFYPRSLVTTSLALGLLWCAGFTAAWRAESVRAGAFAGIASTAIAALISLVGALVLLALWHDPSTMAAIKGSGGLGEVFVLPWMAILSGAIIGAVGGVVGAAASRLRPG